MSKKLFIIVSTGQQVSNLPPVIEKADNGDNILWIESSVSVDNAWTKNANKILEERGFKILKSIKVNDINSPVSIIKQINDSTINITEYEQVFAVANGGPKFTPIALYIYLKEKLKQKFIFLYNNFRPAELQIFDSSLHMEKHNYTKNLTLQEILKVKGSEIDLNRSPDEFWSIAEQKNKPPCPKQFINKEGYIDKEYISDFHRKHHEKNQFSKFELYKPKYEHLKILMGEKEVNKLESVFNNFCKCQNASANAINNLYMFFRKFMGYNKIAPEKLHKEIIIKEEFFENLFYIYKNSNNKSKVYETLYSYMCNKLANNISINISEKSNPDNIEKIGPIFEDFVKHKVFEILEETNGFNETVVSAWSNVYTSNAEFDILFILKGAILIHIECKSYTADLKDLNARITTLRENSSNLAEMLVTAPIYTDFPEEEWTQGILKFKLRLDKNRLLNFIPFTLDDQPSNISYKDKDKKSKIPSFKETLTRFMLQYSKKKLYKNNKY